MPLFLRVKSTTRNRVSSLHYGFMPKYGSSKILPSCILELTKSSRRQMGQAFNSFSIPFNNPNSSNALSFTTSFVFSINAPGHGLTFLISPSMDRIQWIGMLLNVTLAPLDILNLSFLFCQER